MDAGGIRGLGICGYNGSQPCDVGVWLRQPGGTLVRGGCALAVDSEHVYLGTKGKPGSRRPALCTCYCGCGDCCYVIGSADAAYDKSRGHSNYYRGADRDAWPSLPQAP